MKWFKNTIKENTGLWDAVKRQNNLIIGIDEGEFLASDLQQDHRR